MPDPNQQYYDWKAGNLQYAPIEFEDNSFSHFTSEKRAQLWDSGLRPARQGWAKAFPDEKDLRVQFVDKGQLSYRNKQGLAKPRDQWTKQQHLDEAKANTFELLGKDKAPLPWTDKTLKPADRYTESIKYFRDNPEDTNRFDAGRMAYGMAKRLPLTFGILDWMEMGHDKAAMDRMYEGTATDDDYFKLAKQAVVAEQEEADPEALHYLRTLSHLPAYAADIALTGGVSAFTKAVGAKAAGKLAKHLGSKKFKEFIQKSMVKKVARAGAEAFTFATVMRGGTTYGEAIPTRDLKFDETIETGFAKTEKDSWFNTLPKSIANQMLEYSVEKFTGVAVGKLAGKARGFFRPPAKVDTSVIPDSLMNLMKKRVITAWKIQNPGRSGLAAKIGYNGMVTELGEEYLTMALQGVNEGFFASLPGYERDAGPQIEGRFGGVGGAVKEVGYQTGLTDETEADAVERRKGMWKEFKTIALGVGLMGGAMRGISGRPTDDPVMGHKDPILGMAAVSVDPEQHEINEKYRKDVFDLIQSGKSSRTAFERVKLPDGTSLYSHYKNDKQREGFLEEAAQMGQAQTRHQEEQEKEQEILDRAEQGLEEQAAEAPIEQPAAVAAPPTAPIEEPSMATEAMDDLGLESVDYEQEYVEATREESEAAVEAPPVTKQPVLDMEQDNKNVETVSQIGIADVRKLVPGRKVSETEYGFDVFFEGGRVPVYMSQDMDLTGEQLEQVYNQYANSNSKKFTHWRVDKKSGKVESFADVFPTAQAYGEYLDARTGIPGTTTATKGGQEGDLGWDILATVRINDTDWSRANRDQMKVLRHELVHVAHLSGMWNKSELASLLKEYNIDPNSSAVVQSEGLAANMELWNKPGMMERFTDWINRLMNKVMPGKFELKPSAVKNLLQQEKFWGRQTQEFSEFVASQDQGKQQDVSGQTLGMAESVDETVTVKVTPKVAQTIGSYVDADYRGRFYDDSGKKMMSDLETKLLNVTSTSNVTFTYEQSEYLQELLMESDIYGPLKTWVAKFQSDNLSALVGIQRQRREELHPKQEQTDAPTPTDDITLGMAEVMATGFSGIGTVEGATTGLKRVLGYEFDPEIVKAYNDTHDANLDPRNISPETAREIAKEIKVAGTEHFHASPVCVNCSKAKSNRSILQSDINSGRAIAQIIEEAPTPTVSIENVPEYQGTIPYDMIIEALDKAGYTYDVGVYDAADYGGSQTRKRLIIRGVLDGDLPPIPAEQPSGDWYTAIEDLIDDAPDEKLIGRKGRKNDELQRIENYVEKGKLTFDKPILTMGGSASKGVPYAANAGNPAPTLLSTTKQVPRIIMPDGRIKRLTGRMMARLMGLPDSFKVPDDWHMAKKTLGNGIHGNITQNIIQPLLDIDQITLGMAEGDLDIHGRDQPKPGLAKPTPIPKARQDYATADAAREQTVITHETVKLEVDRLRAGTPQQRAATDQAALEKWRNNPKEFDVFDHEHMIRWAEELSFSTKQGDYELAIEIILLKREAVGMQARSVAYGKDPYRNNPILSRHSSLQDAIFRTSREELALFAQRKSKDPRKARAGQKAFDKEEKRIEKMRKFVEKLGYEFTKDGLRRLARNKTDAYKVAQYAVRSKWGYGTWAYNMFTEYTYGSMLSGLNTQVVNLMSNTSWGVAMEIEQFGAAAVNSLFKNSENITLQDYRNAAKRGKLKHKPAEMLAILKIARKNAWARLTTEQALLEQELRSEEKTKMELNVPAIPGKIGKAFRMTHGFGPMAAVDQLYKTIFTHMDVGVHAFSLARQQVERFNRNNPELKPMTQEDIHRLAEAMIDDKTSQAWQDALHEAEQKMFQDEGGFISQKILGLAKTARGLPFGLGAGFQHLIAPFVRTPVRLMGNAVIRLPGFGTVVTTGKMLNNYKDGKHVLDGVSREIVGQIAVGIIGTIIAMGVSEDEEETMFTGAKGSLGKDSRSFRYSEGVAPSQGVKLFGQWVRYDRFDPFAVQIAAIVDGVHAWKSGKGLGGAIKDVGLSTAASIQEKSFTRSLGDLMKAVDEDENQGQRFIASAMTRLIPNWYQQASRANRETIGEKRGETVLEEWRKRSEIAPSEDIHDAWGRKAKSAGWLPFKYKTADAFVGDRVFLNWNRLNPDAREPKYPTRPSRDYRREGIDRRMDDKTYSEYARIAGTLSRNVIGRMISAAMGRNPSDRIMAMVESSLSRARVRVKDHLHKTGTLEGFNMEREERMLQSALYSSMLGVMKRKRPIQYGQPAQEYQEELDKWQRDRDAAMDYAKWYRQNSNTRIRQ